MTLRKIRFRQTGGFAGLVRGCELAPKDLDTKEGARLERLLRQSGLAESAPAHPAAPAQGPDRDSARDLIKYEIEIESASGTARFELDDLDLSENVALLVAFLLKHARPMPLDRRER
jgi:Emfourin